MPKITNIVELDAMEFGRACHSIENFCATAYLNFTSMRENLESRRTEAKRQDTARWGEPPNGIMHYDGLEIEVGYEQVSLSEEEELLGLFALVFITSRLEKFFEDVARSCGWPTSKKASWSALVSVLQKNGKFSFSDGPVSYQWVEELFFARNDFVHNRGLARKEYLDRIPSPRFIKDGKIIFTHKDVIDATTELLRVADFIVTKCKPFSRLISHRQSS